MDRNCRENDSVDAKEINGPMTSTPTARDLFVQSVLRISAAIDGPGLATAREIFIERLQAIDRLQDDLDAKWVAHRDQGGPLPSAEIERWEKAWLNVARVVRVVRVAAQ